VLGIIRRSPCRLVSACDVPQPTQATLAWRPRAARAQARWHSVPTPGDEPYLCPDLAHGPRAHGGYKWPFSRNRIMGPFSLMPIFTSVPLWGPDTPQPTSGPLMTTLTPSCWGMTAISASGFPQAQEAVEFLVPCGGSRCIDSRIWARSVRWSVSLSWNSSRSFGRAGSSMTRVNRS